MKGDIYDDKDTMTIKTITSVLPFIRKIINKYTFNSSRTWGRLDTKGTNDNRDSIGLMLFKTQVSNLLTHSQSVRVIGTLEDDVSKLPSLPQN